MKKNKQGAFGTKAMLMAGMLAAVLAFGLVLTGCGELLSSDAGLSSVAGVSPGTWTSGDGTYRSPYQGTIDVPSTKTTIVVADIVPASGATAKLYTGTLYYAELSATGQALTASFPSGDTLYIKVTAEDGSTVAYYEPTVRRAPEAGTTLTADRWANGDISVNYEVDWYSFTASAGTTYYIWWNDSGNLDGEKTADVDVYAYCSDKTEIFWDSHDSGWSSAKTIRLSANDTVMLRVRCYGGYLGTGTYGIVFSTTNSRPATTP
ncbi:hypothetical protein FACS189483_08320 [Spirochaetia bacterium]|nr:hypothetical protein FACS189483_08320 [Spirochaetia bacterium]